MSPETNEALETTNARLIEKVLSYLPGHGDFDTAVGGLTLFRRDEMHTVENCFYQPIIALTLQGQKRSIVGTEEYRYGAGHCFINGVDMPSLSYVTETSLEKPFLVVGLNIDSQLTNQLAAEFPVPKSRKSSIKGMVVSATDPQVLGAFSRLLELHEKPEQIPVMAPMIIREIHFRLLTGPQGDMLRLTNTVGTLSNQVFQAITWLRNNFATPLEVDSLAKNVNMSPPSFRRHFREVTTMSPTQYLKRLRLYEAQRLMLEEERDAANASYAVGYESPSQFSREYKRLFGEAPQRDVARLRQAAFA